MVKEIAGTSTLSQPPVSLSASCVQTFGYLWPMVVLFFVPFLLFEYLTVNLVVLGDRVINACIESKLNGTWHCWHWGWNGFCLGTGAVLSIVGC